MNNMNLKDAVDILTEWVQVDRDIRDSIESDYDNFCEEKCIAIDTVLRAIKIKDEYLKFINDLLIDYDGCVTTETLKELIDEEREYIHKALNNDDKSVIAVNGKGKKFNILHEEVKDEQ